MSYTGTAFVSEIGKKDHPNSEKRWYTVNIVKLEASSTLIIPVNTLISVWMISLHSDMECLVLKYMYTIQIVFVLNCPDHCGIYKPFDKLKVSWYGSVHSAFCP